MAIVGALLTYGFYFAGFHETAEKTQLSQWISMGVGLVVSIACYALAMRDRRDEFPVDKNWGYGSAVAAGVMTSLWAALLGGIAGYVYLAIINPQFSELAYQMQVAKMEKANIPSAQIEASAGMMRKFFAPGVMTGMQVFWGFISGVIISLIIAIFFRNRNLPDAPAETTPPTLG